MPEVIFPGPDGRLEGRYHPQKDRDAPIAIVLHPHPQFGGTMNNKVVYNLHYAFYNMGFTVLRFNFRGVGRSQGEYDQGIGELSDAASALDYLQSMNNNSKHCWVDIGATMTQQMRALAARPPYFVNGSADTLRELVDFYDRRFNIGYTDQEKIDLINFMRAL